MSFVVFIPARLNSERLPAKVLLPLRAKPIIEWVYEKAVLSGAARVVVATDNERVQAHMQALGAEVVMTRPDHATGSDRIAEAARLLGLVDDTILVNIQADEPFMSVANIQQVAHLLSEHEVPMATLCCPIDQAAKVVDPNTVKVVRNRLNEALYFSRSVIPHIRGASLEASIPSQTYYQHIGIYAYRAHFLQQYVTWGESSLENLEKLEQLRVLWHGAKLYVGDALEPPLGDINTLEDWQRAKQYLES